MLIGLLQNQFRNFLWGQVAALELVFPHMAGGMGGNRLVQLRNFGMQLVQLGA